MSVSLWAWTEECDGRICVGDCDLCSVDVVEVVRCRDCIHWEFRDGWDHCRFFDWLLEDDNGYCHFGERREDSPQDGIWKCSMCDYIRLVDDITPINYCPNCGAKMDESEEEEWKEQ